MQTDTTNRQTDSRDLVYERADELGFEDVAERYPVEESHQSVQSGPH